ncbi:MAG: type II secretion system GspH family protein [Coriobacteriales bacterium]|jgi:type II secretory pathway pseudopilin PulG|nr:type II secretion system GspH family protein [Coriobacteriales bacterium]
MTHGSFIQKNKGVFRTSQNSNTVGLSTQRNRGGTLNPPRSRVFFLEMLLNILIFAICATVALQVFVEAKVEIDRSQALTQLTVRAETMAETFKATGGQTDLLTQTLGVEFDDIGGALRSCEYFDGDLDATGKDEAVYTLEFEFNPAEYPGDVATACIIASNEDTELFTVEVKGYLPRASQEGVNP